MYSDSTDEMETPHFAYLVLRVFPPFPTEIVVICHHAKTNDIFLLGGCVGPSPLTNTRRAAPSQSQRFYSRRFAPIIVVPHLRRSAAFKDFAALRAVPPCLNRIRLPAFQDF